MRRPDLLAQLSAALAGRATAGEEAGARLQELCDIARADFHAAACSVAAVEHDHVHYLVAAGVGSETIVGTELPISRGIGGYVAATGQALAVDQPAADQRFARDVAESTGYVPESMLVLPVLADDDVLGILTVLDRGTATTEALAPEPAWSEAFGGAGPGAAPHLGLPGRPSREWAYGDARGRGVRIAVVDSGVEAGHPLVGGLAGAFDVRFEHPSGDVIVVEEAHEDLYGHGTACAGLIRTLAPDVELTSVRVLGPKLRGNATIFAEALSWCIAQRFDVVNLSLSTSNSKYLGEFWQLADRAAFDHVLLVSAMNNERKLTIPSEFAGVCSVACGPGQDVEDVWCNPAGPPEWGAAGIELEVAWGGGARVVASGNSFSAAIVSGHLARIIGAHPGITPWQARTVLASVAANASDS